MHSRINCSTPRNNKRSRAHRHHGLCLDISGLGLGDGILCAILGVLYSVLGDFGVVGNVIQLSLLRSRFIGRFASRCKIGFFAATLPITKRNFK